MDQFSMYVKRDGSKVSIMVHVPQINGDNETFPFSFECGKEWIARLLYQSLNNSLQETIKAVREEEYNAGLKDARGKKDKRRDFFYTTLYLGVKE